MKIDTLKEAIAQDDNNDNPIVFWSSNIQLRCLVRFDDLAFFLDLWNIITKNKDIVIFLNIYVIFLGAASGTRYIRI